MLTRSRFSTERALPFCQPRFIAPRFYRGRIRGMPINDDLAKAALAKIEKQAAQILKLEAELAALRTTTKKAVVADAEPTIRDAFATSLRNPQTGDRPLPGSKSGLFR
jgi:hypothetical protein